MNVRQVNKERHKRWGTNSVWQAEWFAMSVAYCKTANGKTEFETWIRERYGDSAPQLLETCYAGPMRRYGPSTGNIGMFNKAASELGVADQFLIQSQSFAANKNICPERTLPAPVRKRGEASSVWLARRSEATILGSKIPDIQWAEMRRIAYSEFDHIRDQMEVWRTQPDIFFGGLLERAASTILSPGIPEADRYSQSCMDAMRSRLHISHLQYAAWSQATALFEELSKRELNSAAAVVRAFKEDDDLLGRIVTMTIWSIELSRWYSGKLPQVLTNSDYLRPYFSRTRDFNGVSHIQTDEAYRRSHPTQDGTIESILCSMHKVNAPSYPPATVLRELHKALCKSSETKKITSEAYDTIGDYAIACEFSDALVETPFGYALQEAVQSAERRGITKSWFPIMSAISQSKLVRLPLEPAWERFGALDNVIKSVVDMWLSCIFSLEARPGLDILIRTKDYRVAYDVFWHAVDQAMWREAQKLERTSGSLAKTFGLFDPNDPNRPLHSERFLRELKKEQEDAAAQRLRQAAAATLVIPESYASAIPVATPQDSVAKAPARSTDGPKVKVKRKKAKDGAAGGVGQAQGRENVPEEDADEQAERKLPDFLPSDWKLNRKTVDIFHRLLGKEEKSGQIRWGDFEKAMTHIGFSVYQTEGSSVRFDPPAKAARPITFHRPHPDSTLTPNIIKWVGARLKRCYGWTAETFSGDPSQAD